MATQLHSKRRRDQKTGVLSQEFVFCLKRFWSIKMQVAISIVPGKWKYNIKSVALIMKKQHTRMLA